MSNLFRFTLGLVLLVCAESHAGWTLKQKIEHSASGGKPYMADRTVRISNGQYRMDESRGNQTHSVIVTKQGTLACHMANKTCMKLTLPAGMDALSSLTGMGIKMSFDRITVKSGGPKRKIAKLACTPHTVDMHVGGQMSGQMLPGIKMSMDGSHKVNGCFTKDAGYDAVAKHLSRQLDSAMAGLITPATRPGFKQWVSAGLLLEGTETFTMTPAGEGLPAQAAKPIVTTMKTKTLSAKSGAIPDKFFQVPAGYKIKNLREIAQQRPAPAQEKSLEADLIEGEEEPAPAVPKAKAKSRAKEQIEDAVADKVKDLFSF